MSRNIKYIALLRGIGPGNPNMRNEKLRRVFENLGFKNVQTVISSGNVLFESPVKNKKNSGEVNRKDFTWRTWIYKYNHNHK